MAQSDNMGLGRHYSHGCGAFGQVGGYRKDVEIENYDEVLGNGQELIIKHIEDIEERKQAAVDFVMEGVQDVADAEAMAVAEKQAEIDEALEPARLDLEDALTEAL